MIVLKLYYESLITMNTILTFDIDKNVMPLYFLSCFQRLSITFIRCFVNKN